MKKITFVCFLLLSVVNSKSQNPGQLKVSFTTVAYGGTYSPYNVLAVWVQSKTGVFIQTLLADASKEKAYLSNWKNVTTAASSPYNVVNATTGATLGSHGTYNCTWNGTNLTGTVLGDDTYTIAMEMDEGGGTKYATFQFKKSGAIQTVTPAGVSGFVNVTLKWTPAYLAALDNPEADKLFQVYPNPAVSSVYVSGIDIEKVQICSLTGKVLLSANEQSINVNTLPNGLYLAIIYCKQGTVVRKMEKM